MHGEHKTAGGKLVVVDLEVRDGHLANVEISGDFFLEPPEALEQIRTAVEGLPVSASESDIATRIQGALDPEAALIGFSPEAVARAVRRALE